MSRRPTRSKAKAPLKWGQIKGVPVGRRFESRRDLATAGVHRHLYAGIDGRKNEGAVSVILSDGFENEDHGEHFTYIGSGGRASDGSFHGERTENQSFENSRNAALKLSALDGKPVRVTRSSRLDSKYAPAHGYRYDGLYTVTNPRLEIDSKGITLCKYDFRRLPDQDPLPGPDPPAFDYPTDIEVRHELFLAAHEERASTDAAPAGADAPHADEGAVVGAPASASGDDALVERVPEHDGHGAHEARVPGEEGGAGPSGCKRAESPSEQVMGALPPKDEVQPNVTVEDAVATRLEDPPPSGGTPDVDVKRDNEM